MSADVWTIQAALEWTVAYLDSKGDENPRLSAEWLLAQACHMKRIDLYVNYERPLSAGEREVLRGFVTRRGRGEPLQYITGEVGFRYISIKVGKGVLIPRPETEVLVSEALKLLPACTRLHASEGEPDHADSAACAGAEGENGGARPKGCAADSADAGGGAGRVRESRPRPLLAADICTGSGCVACSIAYEHPDVAVLATDISSEAVALADENVQALGLAKRIDVFRCDLGEGIPSDYLGSLDLVVSNPPYVPTSILDALPCEVRDFEPVLALDGGADGLDVYRRLLAWSAQALRPGAGFAVELHEASLESAVLLAEEAGFADIHVVEDLTARPRVLTARLPS